MNPHQSNHRVSAIGCRPLAAAIFHLRSAIFHLLWPRRQAHCAFPHSSSSRETAPRLHAFCTTYRGASTKRAFRKGFIALVQFAVQFSGFKDHRSRITILGVRCCVLGIRSAIGHLRSSVSSDCSLSRCPSPALRPLTSDGCPSNLNPQLSTHNG